MQESAFTDRFLHNPFKALPIKNKKMLAVET
jgi:hypothetical protein